MENKMIYLDNAATTQPSAAAAQAMMKEGHRSGESMRL